MRVLVVEEDAGVAHALARVIREGAGCAVEVVGDGHAAIAAVANSPFDLVLLAGAAPAVDGPAVCRHLRAAGYTTPILLLSTNSGVADRVSGLDAGADDYLVQPYDRRELLARVRALFRRTP